MRCPWPAVLVLAVASVAAAPAVSQGLGDGRLFTTGEQRAHLDDLRAGTDVSRDDGEARPDQPELPELERRPPPSVRLQGFVRRSGGPPAVWLNDGSTLSGDRVGGDLRVHSGRIQGDTVIVELPDGRIVRLKPGQTWDPESGRVVDSFRH